MNILESQPTGILRCRIDKPSPVIAIAVHSGHRVRSELLPNLEASEAQRLYEEDPGTDQLLEPFPIAITSDTSRFEVDLNRRRENCVYLGPETCWGIELWNMFPTAEQQERSRARHDEAWAFLDGLVDQAVQRFGYCVLLDYHSYCWRRERHVPHWWDDPGRPFVNLGTRDTHPRFRGVLDALLASIRPLEWKGRRLTVGENVIFEGGNIHRHQNARYPDRVLVPSIELKKVFMDEHAGTFHEPEFSKLVREFNTAVYGVLDRLPELLPELATESPFV